MASAPLTIGIAVYDMPAGDVVALGAAADRLGFDALWLGEHVVLPVAYASDHPTSGEASAQHHTGPIVGADTHLIDPVATLGAVAAATTEIHLATGIYVLPLRHPLLTARAAATLHQLSGGRFLLGVGAGWLREEFAAMDVPFGERHARFEEAIAVLRAAWRGGQFEHHGTYFDCGPVQVTPHPVDVPLVLGGNSEPALARAAALADAWFSSGTPSLEDALRLRDRIHALAKVAGRQAPRCYVRIPRVDPELVDRYVAGGISDLVVWGDQVWPSAPRDVQHAALAQAATYLQR